MTENEFFCKQEFMPNGGTKLRQITEQNYAKLQNEIAPSGGIELWDCVFGNNFNWNSNEELTSLPP